MQSVPSIARALYRIVFRGGTPQRIQFSTRLMLIATALTVATAIIAGRYFFTLSAVEIGLMLFTVLSGLYIGAALLTRTVPRPRLRASLLTVFLLLGSAGTLLALLSPLSGSINHLSTAAGLAVLLALISGTTNTVQWAKGTSRASAALLTITFTAILGAFYATLRWLLETVFS